MLAKVHDPFISLKRDQEQTAGIEAKVDAVSYPSFYVRDISLPLTDADIDKIITAEVKLKPKRISTTIENGKKTDSYDIEITGIRIKG